MPSAPIIRCLEFCKIATYNAPLFSAGIAQLVERNLAKVEVASSNLVSRSRYQGKVKSSFAFPFDFLELIPGPYHKGPAR